MRVLVVNKFWYVRGGLERVMFDEIAMLEAAGHAVGHFSMAHPENVASPWSRHFAPYMELGAGTSTGLRDRAMAAGRLFENRAAAKGFGSVLEEFSPDVVHVHGIHRQLSPSILAVAARQGVPVVQTLHDYHHICPADVLLRGGFERCDPRDCGKFNYVPAIAHRCVRGSLGASGLSAAETFFQRMRGAYERGIARFISPSHFLADRMRDGGWDTPVVVIPNCVALTPQRGASQSQQGFLYSGRLSPEKGIDVLLEAARIADVELRLAGTGPLDSQLRVDYPQATFLGHLSADEVGAALRSCRAAVVPSVWFENAPMSVLEAMAAGVAVIASRVGGIPELVEDGVEGLLVEPGSASSLAAALQSVQKDPTHAAKMGAAGLHRARTEFSPEKHLGSLLGVYGEVITARRAS
jgi:glycosyltransferase involved in cell wall biosynthesis